MSTYDMHRAMHKEIPMWLLGAIWWAQGYILKDFFSWKSGIWLWLVVYLLCYGLLWKLTFEKQAAYAQKNDKTNIRYVERVEEYHSSPVAYLVFGVFCALHVMGGITTSFVLFTMEKPLGLLLPIITAALLWWGYSMSFPDKKRC